jgi:hypothetical protein
MVSEKRTFTATDGKEFDSKEDAIAHEQITEAYKAYTEAVEKLQIAISEKLVTADGHPFKIGGHTRYYYIPNPFSSHPTVVDIIVSFYGFELDNHNHRRALAEYYVDGSMKAIVCDIDDIYVSSKKAWEKAIELYQGKKMDIDNRISVITERCL